MDKKVQIQIWYVLIAVIGVLLLQSLGFDSSRSNRFLIASFRRISGTAKSTISSSPKVIFVAS
jgi:hypothetical protein